MPGALAPIPTFTQTGTVRHASSPDCTSLGCGRKPESLEETHADTGRMNSTDSGPGQESFFFPHQRYNEVTLFKDLVYLIQIH